MKFYDLYVNKVKQELTHINLNREGYVDKLRDGVWFMPYCREDYSDCLRLYPHVWGDYFVADGRVFKGFCSHLVEVFDFELVEREKLPLVQYRYESGTSGWILAVIKTEDEFEHCSNGDSFRVLKASLPERTFDIVGTDTWFLVNHETGQIIGEQWTGL